MIRLGTKYEIDYLREEAVALLSAEFPLDLDLWDINVLKSTNRLDRSGRWFLLDVVNLAHEFNLQTLLPVIYLCFIRHYLFVSNFLNKIQFLIRFSTENTC